MYYTSFNMYIYIFVFQFNIHAVRIFGRKLPPVDGLPPFHIHIDRFRRGDFRFHIQLAQHEADRVATQLPAQEAQVLQVRSDDKLLYLININYFNILEKIRNFF